MMCESFLFDKPQNTGPIERPTQGKLAGEVLSDWNRQWQELINIIWLRQGG